MKLRIGNGVLAGISERTDGSMIWWNGESANQEILLNRRNYFGSLSINPERVVTARMNHGINVARVGQNDAGRFSIDVDSLITQDQDLILTVTVADCLPVYFYDPIQRAVGIAHAGWRGLVAGVLENTIQELQKSLGSKPANIAVLIGPHIGVCHYPVGDEVAKKINSIAIEKRDGDHFANLTAEAILRLRGLGVRDISDTALCTYCEIKKFYSARRDNVKPIQGMAAYIGLK